MTDLPKINPRTARRVLRCLAVCWLSTEEIALELGLAECVVKSIRSGRYELLPENYTRCPSCGHDVKMPCPACAVKKQHDAAPHFASGWIYFPTEAGSPEKTAPTLELDLKPKHYKRYLQIQKKKRRSLPDRTAVENPAALSGG